MPGLLGVGRELDGVGGAIGPHDLRGHALHGERLVPFVREPGPQHDRLAQLVAVAIHQQRAARRAAEQSPLAHVPHQLREEHLEVGGIDRPQPPEFATAEVEHLAGAVELAGDVQRQLVAKPASGSATRA